MGLESLKWRRDNSKLKWWYKVNKLDSERYLDYYKTLSGRICTVEEGLEENSHTWQAQYNPGTLPFSVLILASCVVKAGCFTVTVVLFQPDCLLD